MSRILLAIITAFLGVTAVCHQVAIAQFLQSKNNAIDSGSSKLKEFDRDDVNNYFNLIENKDFLDNYQARIGSNAWFINAFDRDSNWQQEQAREREPLYFRSQVESGKQRISSSRAQETSTIALDSHSLRQPHYLTVTAEKGTEIIGQITLDGKAIQNIRGHRTAINLSSCLSRGRHLIEVFGNYKPASSSVQVEFSAPGTTVSQATGGNGAIRQTLILDVR